MRSYLTTQGSLWLVVNIKAWRRANAKGGICSGDILSGDTAVNIGPTHKEYGSLRGAKPAFPNHQHEASFQDFNW